MDGTPERASSIPRAGPTTRARPRLRSIAAAAAAAALTGAIGAGCGRPYDQGPVVISMAFDDGNADAFDSHTVLAGNGQHATYFVSPSRIDTLGYMSKAQLLTLQQEGHEIGGQTLSATRIRDLLDYQQRYQICAGRTAMAALGFDVTTFAFPVDVQDPASASNYPATCGYSAARVTGGLINSKVCRTCAWAESMPPQNPFTIRTARAVGINDTFLDLETYVNRVRTQHGGGWIVFVFHHVCASGCTSDSVDPAVLSQFSNWLPSKGIAVKTIHEVLTGTSASSALTDEEPPSAAPR